MEATYSNNYQNPQTAANYDEVICRSGEDPVWAVEQELLRRMIRKHVPNASSARTLDFACGTGRILEALRPVVGALTGVDISAAMLERAAARVPGVELVCADVTAEAEKLPADVDLLTSFRFLLLAEPSLREACLRALVGRVKKDGGVVILNSHGNPMSFRFLATVKDVVTGRPRRLQKFSMRDMKELASRVGLEIVDATGCGHVPMSMRKILPGALTRGIERTLGGCPVAWRFGTNLLFVLKPVAAQRERGHAAADAHGKAA